MVPKHTTGFRSAAQLDPVDCLLFTGLVYEMSSGIEAFRVPRQQKVACAYRLDVQPDGQFFGKDTGWADFHSRSSDYANQRTSKFVISADISDFYNQISHHRIQNSLASAGISENRSKTTEALLSNVNAAHHSRGIPVGPSASILLAECALADVDNFLIRRQFKYTRYVDDFRIFCESKQQAVRALHDLSEYLFTAHRLSLQAGKTVTLSIADFKARELADPEELERTKKEQKIADLIAAIPEYGADETDDDEVEEEALRDTLEELLDEVLKPDFLPIGLARYVLRRAGTLRTRIILQETLDNVGKLLPVYRDVVVYWLKVVNKKRPEQIGEVLKHVIQASDYRSLPYVQYWTLAAFESGITFCDAATAIEMAEASDPQIRERMAALIARRFGIVDWVRGKKETWSNTSAWGQRAIVWASAVLPRDERNHWLKGIANYPVVGTAAIAEAALVAS